MKKSNSILQPLILAKGYVLLESSDGPLWWQEIDVPEKGLDVEVPINKEWARHDLYI